MAPFFAASSTSPAVAVTAWSTVNVPLIVSTLAWVAAFTPSIPSTVPIVSASVSYT